MSWIMRSITTRVLLHARHEGPETPGLDEDRLFDDLLQLLHGPVEALHVADVQHGAVAAGDREQLVRLLEGGRDGLLDEHADARFQEIAGHLEVLSVGTATLATSTCPMSSRWSVNAACRRLGRDRRALAIDVRRRRPGRRPTARRRRARGTDPCGRLPTTPARSPVSGRAISGPARPRRRRRTPGCSRAGRGTMPPRGGDEVEQRGDRDGWPEALANPLAGPGESRARSGRAAEKRPGARRRSAARMPGPPEPDDVDAAGGRRPPVHEHERGDVGGDLGEPPT